MLCITDNGEVKDARGSLAGEEIAAVILWGEDGDYNRLNETIALFKSSILSRLSSQSLGELLPLVEDALRKYHSRIPSQSE